MILQLKNRCDDLVAVGLPISILLLLGMLVQNGGRTIMPLFLKYNAILMLALYVASRVCVPIVARQNDC